MDTRLTFSPPAEAPPDAPDWDALYTVWLPRVYNYFRYRLGDDPLGRAYRLSLEGGQALDEEAFAHRAKGPGMRAAPVNPSR